MVVARLKLGKLNLTYMNMPLGRNYTVYEVDLFFSLLNSLTSLSIYYHMDKIMSIVFEIIFLVHKKDMTEKIS